VSVIGIDACKSGWIAVVLRRDAPAEAHYLPSIDVVGSLVPDAEVVAVDIPIGLPTTGFRAADREARRFVGGSSVFQVPCRAVLEAPTHAEATARSVEWCGIGISRQAYGLGPKIFEVEAWIRTAPCGVYEVHPEVAFAVLLGRRPGASKKTWAGMIERREALAGQGIRLDHATGLAASRAAVDDMLDAGVAAWSGRRILDRSARSFPDPPEVDGAGRPVAIWA
jgi:predicted RNase H-like nuclease